MKGNACQLARVFGKSTVSFRGSKLFLFSGSFGDLHNLSLIIGASAMISFEIISGAYFSVTGFYKEEAI